MSPHVVRNMRSETTHVMDVTGGTHETAFGATYFRPWFNRAACGVAVADGVQMQPGRRVTCRACRHVTGVTEEPQP